MLFFGQMSASAGPRVTWGGDRTALCGTFHGSRRYLGMETAGKVQECLDHEAYCKKHAAWATDDTARDAFTECARCWRELSDCWRELTSRNTRLTQ